MRNGLLAVVALTTCGVAIADSPPQQVIEDLNDLRQELGQSNSTPAEFAQAVQSIVEGRVEEIRPRDDWAAQTWVGDVAPQPTLSQLNYGPSPQPAPPPGQVVPVRDLPLPPPQYHQPGQFIATNPYVPGPPPHHAKPGPRPPKVLLQDTAFDLERMAHELDKADLYGEADALRGAANRLRMSARQQKKPDGPPQPPVVDRSSLPIEHPHAAERARRAIQEANERVQQMERRVAETEARLQNQAQESRRRMQPLEQQRRQALEGGYPPRQEAQEVPRRPRERRRERPARSDRPRRDRLDLPPAGVHGGPTDPPPAPTDGPEPHAD